MATEAVIGPDSGAWLRYRAPGKMFLAGEYAVTDGSWAVVAAVPPWGELRASAGAVCEPVQPLYPGAGRVETARGMLDTRRFFRNGQKLGFGSSATAAVLLTAARRGVSAPEVLWRDAEQTHAELVGKTGSGGDLAAVIHGGAGLFRRRGTGLEWRPVPFPASAILGVVQAGQAADTRRWVERLAGVRGTDAWRAWCSEVDRSLSALEDGVALRDVLNEAVKHYRRLREWLGDELYPPLFEQCHEIACRLELPFKPSGAGGGDIGFFYTEHTQQWQRLRQAAQAEGVQVIPVRPTQTGIVCDRLARYVDDATTEDNPR